MVMVQSDPSHPPTPAAMIPLSNGMFALVDPDMYDHLIKYNWFAKKSCCRWYAVMITHVCGQKKFMKMHRVVANTPTDMVCHHVNNFTLDNRIANLQNLSHYNHVKMYSYR